MKFFAQQVSVASVTMQVLVLTTRSASRWAARAFVATGPSRILARPLVASTAFRFQSTVRDDTGLPATVEDDIDAVLDSVLGDVYKVSSAPDEDTFAAATFPDDGTEHMEGSKPIPDILVEQVSPSGSKLRVTAPIPSTHRPSEANDITHPLPFFSHYSRMTLMILTFSPSPTPVGSRLVWIKRLLTR
jgi:hypothetical protein